MNAKQRLHELIKLNQPQPVTKIYQYALTEGIAQRKTEIKTMLKSLEIEGKIQVCNGIIKVKK